MNTNDRISIFPSRGNFVLMKQRVNSATKGHSLLKRKRDALELKQRELKAQLKEETELMYVIMQEAIFSIAKAVFLGADFNPIAVMGAERADVFMRNTSTKVVGVMMPKFELVMHAPTSCPLTGLSRGGVQIETVREKFQKALKSLVSLASLMYSVDNLEVAIRQTNMRVNGLEYVLIPRFENTVTYIRDELDEFEREDRYRLKRSQAKQTKAKETFSRTIKMKNADKDAIENAMQNKANATEPAP